MNDIIVLDFETTGLIAGVDRVIEVAAVRVKDGKIVEKFCELMNPGFSIPSFISKLTGITNHMLKGKRAPELIMPELKKFIGDSPIVAHNASFDYCFLQAEMAMVKIYPNNPILCTMKLARRLIPLASDYKLTTLAKVLNIDSGQAHRALSDVLVTAKVWEHLYTEVKVKSGLEKPDICTMLTVSKRSKVLLPKFFESLRAKDKLTSKKLLH